jgi:hypothetical protein
MARGSHTLEHAETRRNSARVATLRINVKAKPLGRLRDPVARRILWHIELAWLGRSPAARAGAPGRR